MLFQNGEFFSHAGESLLFKIDCDALTDEDLATLATIIARNYKFSRVVGVPRGGNRLADALSEHCSSVGTVLIVDDVLTTGKSMEELRDKIGVPEAQGVVIFARGDCPSWVQPIFQLAAWARP